jgi:hypothetical protein
MRISSCRDIRVVAGGWLLAFAVVLFSVAPAKADDSGSPSRRAVATPNVHSYPPDLRRYSRPLVAEDLSLSKTAGAGVQAGVSFFVVDAVVNNTDPNLRSTDTFNNGETSIAINPTQPNVAK